MDEEVFDAVAAERKTGDRGVPLDTALELARPPPSTAVRSSSLKGSATGPHSKR